MKKVEKCDDFSPTNIFDKFELKAAHQNDSKKESRELIAKTVKSVYGDKPVTFVEFLGAGKGAEYYASNLNVNRMLLAERVKKDYNLFYRKEYRKFCRDNWPMVVDLFYGDLQQHIKIANPFYWNVINLDFCAYCYEYNDSSDGSPLSLIEEFFKSHAVMRNETMIIASFMIGGYSLRIATRHNKKIYNEEKTITDAIGRIAKKYGFSLDKVLSNTYDSNPKTAMINLGFRVK